MYHIYIRGLNDQYSRPRAAKAARSRDGANAHDFATHPRHTIMGINGITPPPPGVWANKPAGSVCSVPPLERNRKMVTWAPDVEYVDIDSYYVRCVVHANKRRNWMVARAPYISNSYGNRKSTCCIRRQTHWWPRAAAENKSQKSRNESASV